MRQLFFLQVNAPHVDKGVHKNIFNIVYKTACNYFDNKECLGVCKIIQLRNNFKLLPTIAHDKLSKAFCKVIYLGKFICMDEKQKKWQGWLPFIKKVLAKK